MYNVYLTGVRDAHCTPSLDDMMAEKCNSFDSFDEAKRIMETHPDTNKKIIMFDTEVETLYEFFQGGVVYVGCTKVASTEEKKG